MNQMYGFEGEVKAKYTPQMFQLFTEVFNYLPLVHCINNKVLVMHGGLFSKDDVTLKDIRAVDRVRQPPEDGLMSELLWSDPQPQNGRSESKRGVGKYRSSSSVFFRLSLLLSGLQFGPDVTERFIKLNNLEYVVRSHEVKQEGYEVAHNGKIEIPFLIESLLSNFQVNVSPYFLLRIIVIKWEIKVLILP